MWRNYGTLTTSGHEHLIADQVFKHIDNNNIPLEVTIELTQRCNLKCHHCYNFDRQDSYKSKPSNERFSNELTPEEIYKLIDDVYNCGCLNITFTGGEALLHPHFFDFVAYVRGKHMGAYLKTNGMLLTQANVQKLKQVRLMGLEVSLYGAKAITHDALTAVPGSFDTICEGVRRAKKIIRNSKVNFVLTRENADQIEAMKELAFDMNVEYGMNPQISSRYDGTDSSLMNQMTPEQLHKAYSGPLADFIPEPCSANANVQCGCARGICGINSSGEVYPCIGAPVPSGNIRLQSFKDIWTTSETLVKIRKLTLNDFDDCKKCPDRTFCRRSSGMVYTNTGNYTGSEPWTCMEAKTIHDIYDANLLRVDAETKPRTNK